MEHIFFSDLDKTLIFSKKNNDSKCIDFKEGKEISYMTNKSFYLINRLLSIDSFIFIPTTLRPINRTISIEFIDKYKPKYIICTNGAEIYIDNKLDEEWDLYMRNLILKEDIRKISKRISRLKTKAYEVSNINDFYLKVKFKNVEDANSSIKQISNLMFGDYYALQQSRMIFVLNKNMKKESAVNYLITKYSFKNIHTAGDSETDEVFTRLKGVKAYLPNHSTFKHKDAFITEKSGLEATEEILRKIIEEIEG